MVGPIDLPQPLQLRLGDDQFALHSAGHFQGRSALLLDIERRVLAGELAQPLFGCAQVLPDDLDALLEKLALPMRGRRIESLQDLVQLLDKRIGNGGRPLRISVHDAERHHSALLVIDYDGAVQTVLLRALSSSLAW